MSQPDASNMPDGRDLIRGMGWEPLPFSCVGIARRTGEVKGDSIWSWIVLVPWSDEKPWIDGTEIVPATTKTHAQEREGVFSKMRVILDQRYGETVAHREVDDLIAEILDET